MMRATLATFLLARTPGLLAGAEEACAADDHSSLLQTKATASMAAPAGPSARQLRAARSKAEAAAPEELRDLPVMQKPYKLKLQETYLPTPWIGGGFWTRGYGDIPGPTMRVKPGEKIEIEFENALGPGTGFENCDMELADVGQAMNPSLICALNISSIHTHGLHVHGNGNGDNVLRLAKPGEVLKYEIEVPENHMGGTHWYHPHVHHATAAQAGGGAHGALIVDDPEDYLPSEVASMPEKLMFLSLVNIAKCMRLEAWGLLKRKSETTDQVLWKNDAYPGWKWTEENEKELEDTIEPELVVNGQFRPKMTLDESKWYRLRMVFASIEQRVEVWLADGGLGAANCEFQLIGKDGVYLHEAPRPIQRIHLSSGSRADVAVQCDCTWRANGPTCGAKVMFRSVWQPMKAMGNVVTMSETVAEMMTLEVKRDQGASPAEPIEPFEVRRPCYLADLRTAVVPRANHHELNLPMISPLVVQFDGHGEVWSHKGPPALANLPVGEVQEWEMTGMQFHPFHLHVNNYQITRIFGDEYYMPGDWHDTMLPAGTNTATVRLSMDRHIGTMIAHCHILEHEDNGMMAWFNIVGEEGTLDAQAQKLDPTCYNGAYPGPVVAGDPGAHPTRAPRRPRPGRWGR
mmetsp:Transcript_79295/g.222346  ORF Transcript_79295/g.222346 Transcript_79295/m.222346 type:complete len:631 (+) Transcript_79295:115-2007(+)